MVEQLADLLGGPLRALVLGGHPGLGGLLDQLLADRMDAGVELLHGAGALGPGLGLLAQLGPELLERLHGQPAYGVGAVSPARLDAPVAASDGSASGVVAALDALEGLGGDERGGRRLVALVLARALEPGAVERLLLVVAGEHPEADRRPGGRARPGRARRWRRCRRSRSAACRRGSRRRARRPRRTPASASAAATTGSSKVPGHADHAPAPRRW